MTGNVYLDLAISLGGIAFLLALAAGLGATASIKLTAENAKERLAFDEPDFRIAEFWIGEACALAISDTDEAAIVFAVGDKLATRRADRETVRTKVADGALVVRFPGLMRKPRLPLAAEAALSSRLGAGKDGR